MYCWPLFYLCPYWDIHDRVGKIGWMDTKTSQQHAETTPHHTSASAMGRTKNINCHTEDPSSLLYTPGNPRGKMDIEHQTHRKINWSGSGRRKGERVPEERDRDLRTSMVLLLPTMANTGWYPPSSTTYATTGALRSSHSFATEQTNKHQFRYDSPLLFIVQPTSSPNVAAEDQTDESLDSEAEAEREKRVGRQKRFLGVLLLPTTLANAGIHPS